VRWRVWLWAPQRAAHPVRGHFGVHSGGSDALRARTSDPNVAKAAHEQKLDEQAARELARLNVPPVTDPLTELARLAGQAVAWKDSMAAKVNELSGIRYSTETDGEQLRAEIVLCERALDRCITTLGAMAKLNIEEWLAGIRRQTADMLERALEAALAASGAGLDGQQAARQAFRANLRVVQAQSENPNALA
jgi:hypothetical protein